MLLDLSDDRRSAKPWLPLDSLDVTNGLVVENWKFFGNGRPRCIKHGAMSRIDQYEKIYRCQECGVGARFVEDEIKNIDRSNQFIS